MHDSTLANEFEIPALQIKYRLVATDNQSTMVQLTEGDFEKIFQKIRDLQNQIGEVQDQLIEALKREALIKNILG
jgi:hypothetical protein